MDKLIDKTIHEIQTLIVHSSLESRRLKLALTSALPLPLTKQHSFSQKKKIPVLLFKNNHKNVEEGKISFCNPWQM
jgi:hypothetical protein